MRLVAATVLCLAFAAAAQAQGPALSAADTTASLLAAHKGKRVTLRLRSGQELAGTVRESNDRLVVLEGLSGREFLDAVVPLDAIEAVLVRNRP